MVDAAELGAMIRIARRDAQVSDMRAHVVDGDGGDKLLLAAAVLGRVDLVRLACDVLAKSGRRQATHPHAAALTEAAECGHVAVVQYLSQFPADVDVHLAVRQASSQGHVAVVRYLCLHMLAGRRVEHVAMLWAAYGGHLEVVRCLCEELPVAQRVDPAAEDNWALACAAGEGHLPVVRYLHDLPRVRHSVPCGGDLNVLKRAWRRDAVDVVEYLLRRYQRGSDVDRIILARHVRDLLVATPHAGSFASPHAGSFASRQERHLVRLACTRVLALDVPKTGFRNLPTVLPLIAHALGSAATAATEGIARAALRGACMLIDVTNVWAGDVVGGHVPSRTRVDVLTALLRDLTVALDADGFRLPSFGARVQRRFWRLLGDVVRLCVPTEQCVTASDRAELYATARHFFANAVPGLRCHERGDILAWLRRFRACMTLLHLRLLREAGRAIPWVACLHRQ